MVRFNHDNGVAPYNGVVAVVHNSRVLEDGEVDEGVGKRLAAECTAAAELVGAVAPIRIDCRQREKHGNCVRLRNYVCDCQRSPLLAFDLCR